MRTAFPPASRAAALAAGLIALSACATGRPTGIPELGVEYSWAGVQSCSGRSPQIMVRDIPAAARRLKVELVDLGAAFSNHGGGVVDVPRDGVIAAGALTDYRGPCPAQVDLRLDMRVSALDAGGRTIAYGSQIEAFVLRRLPSRPAPSSRRR